MSSSENEEEAVFEEDEVLWAKIRGYPWWPAYVRHQDVLIDKIDSHKQEAQYTVIFFGDNTQYFSAKLGPFKLRKFIEFYTDFYPKAKTNRKLMTAIQMAEERLRQNDQEVHIFEEMRTQLKAKPSKHLDLPPYKFTKSDPLDNKSQEGSLPLKKVRSNISSKRRGRKRQIKEESLSQSSSKSEQEEIVATKVTRRRPIERVAQIMRQRPKRVVQEEIFEEEEDEQSNKVVMKNEKVEVEQEDNHEDNSEAENDDDVDYKMARQRKSKSIVHTGPRRRGRPRKYAQQVKIQPKEDALRSLSIEISKKSKSRPKQQQQSQPQSPTPASISEQTQAILRQIRQIVDSRQDLIQYLEKIKVTPQNVKQMLDLNVTNILQNGPVDGKVKGILNVLKSALLLRYFPEDIKHIKNYQKLSKKKSVFSEARQQKSMQPSESSIDMQIRKKTTIKLQQFLKNHPQSSLNTKQSAVKLESIFFRTDSEMGARYKKIAYDVLSSIKDRREDVEQLIQRLEIGSIRQE